VRFEVLTAVLLKVQVFWDVMPDCWGNVPYVSNVIPSFETSVTTRSKKQRYFPEDSIL
jgi:hypothetical protein